MARSYKDGHQVQHNQVYHGCCPGKRPLVQPDKYSVKLVCTPHHQSVVQGGWRAAHQACKRLKATSATARQDSSLNVKLVVLIFLVCDEVGRRGLPLGPSLQEMWSARLYSDCSTVLGTVSRADT